MTHRHDTDHPAPGPSEDGPGAGVWGEAQNDAAGPPDWFAAVAENDDASGPPDWFAAVAEEPPARLPAAEPAQELAVGELPGLMRASELAAGRRRRRSELGELPFAAPVEEKPRPKRRARTERTEAQRSEGGRSTTERAEAGRSEGASGAGRRGRGAAEQGDPAERARDICLRLLTGAAKSRKQLADALRRKEIPDEVAEQVLSRLEEVGLIDDAAFAEAWVESRHAVRGLSRRALAQELRTKGVTGETAERALLQVDAEDESEAARALVERKLRSTAGLDRDVRMRRLVGVLARRGYAEGLAFRVVREALDAEPAEGDDW
ncbi:RecX family transcriptional regulator [Kitasatospora sp. NPDC092948]|uniref:RecX family transcriptional regulator n=1 Tax=Kitasatospora sp. NPDC092948 TaxID=3364088 RepID=UPI003813761E